MRIRKAQSGLRLKIPRKVIIEPIIDLPRHFRVFCIVDVQSDRLGVEYLFLNPIISHLPIGKPEKPENVVTTEYFIVTLKAAVWAAAMRWPDTPIEIERDQKRITRRPIVLEHFSL